MLEVLPTPLAAVAARRQLAGHPLSVDRFLTATYFFEACLKYICICAVSSTSPVSVGQAGFRLVRADGLGEWDTILRESVSRPADGHLPQEVNELRAWAVQRRTEAKDPDFVAAYDAALRVGAALGISGGRPKRLNMLHLTGLLVQIRNKSKAHGAVGAEFATSCNADYIASTDFLATSCPAVVKWGLVYLRPTANAQVRLVGRSPNAEEMSFAGAQGLHISISKEILLPVAALLYSGIEALSFYFANGLYRPKGDAEYIDYASGSTIFRDVGSYRDRPAPLPKSETSSSFELDVVGSAFSNLPEAPSGYVPRNRLEAELKRLLMDRNHRVITLHGPGGIGKTWLALTVCHAIADSDVPSFDNILWFSARDVDLTISGPRAVRKDVSSVESISKAVCQLYEEVDDLESFTMLLQDPAVADSASGVLFVFDNFETMDDQEDVHRFLDHHICLPNKVLITSRSRDFVADYPVSVAGMDVNEAMTVIRAASRELYVEGLVDSSIARKIYDECAGHPYLMRLLVGEIAKAGKYIPMREFARRRVKVVRSILERSFSRMSEEGRWLFLVVSFSSKVIPVFAAESVLGARGLSFEVAFEECRRLSLIRVVDGDGEESMIVPPVAREFAATKLNGEPRQVELKEDGKRVRQLAGAVAAHGGGAGDEDGPLVAIVRALRLLPKTEPEHGLKTAAAIIEQLAYRFPWVWKELTQLLTHYDVEYEELSRVTRAMVEDNPYDGAAWQIRAEIATSVGDMDVAVSSYLQAVEVQPTDLDLAVFVALQVCHYINSKKDQIPATQRGAHLASIRDRLERDFDRLDATALSRLAWLYLLEENRDGAVKATTQGMKIDPNNTHCEKLARRLNLV